MRIITKILEQDIKKSAEKLDEIKPNWFKIINFESLDMFHNCILDQVYKRRRFNRR